MSGTSAAPYNPQGGWFATALFVVLFCYFWIGLHPLPAPSTTAGISAYGETSDLFNQLIVVLMTLGALTALALHPSRELAIRAFGPLALIFLWIAVTILFSDLPATALRRTIYSLLTCICASAMLLLPRDSSHFAKLIGLCMLLALGLSYFGVLVLPQRAIHQASDIAEEALAGDWRGIFGHKNSAAMATGFAVIVGLYVMKARSVVLGLVLTVLAAVFLIKSGGKTSAVMLPVVLVGVWVFERIGPLRLAFVGGALALTNFLILSVAVSPQIRTFVAGLGLDASFTGRDSIWQLALSAIANRPITGYGFQSFWQTDALFYGGQSASTWAVTAANAHNAYIDQLINGGWPLLIMVVVWLVILPCRHASMALARGNDSDLTRFYLRIWLFGLFTSCFESPFFQNNGPIWFTIMLAVFGLRLQARADLVDKTANAGMQMRPVTS